jgi:PncC family amidohydrolase
MATPEQEIGELLRRKGLTVATVESATGGLIAHRLTNVPGISDNYKGSVVAYKNEIKTGVVGVRPETISTHGAVSSPTAEEMAAGGKRLLGADICIADTGIAGPSGGTAEKPVGLFYLGLAHGDKAMSRRHEFHGDREQNKQGAAEAALQWLKEYILGI